MNPLLWLRDYAIDTVIRRKAALHELPTDRFSVRVARCSQEYEDAFRLLHVAYAYLGIESHRNVDMRITAQHVLPEATVFVAYENDLCVGTMTVTLDSPAGIPLEHDYPTQVEGLRNSGARLVEYGSLAVVKRCWHNGVTGLLNMAATYWAINMLQATHIVMGAHPRALKVYRALFGFAPLGSPKHHAELAAPVVGMHVPVAVAVDTVRRYFPKPMASGLPYAEHGTRSLPPCISIPTHVPHDELCRWKLPREVFQDLFVHKSDRLRTLDTVTLHYLMRVRSQQTLIDPVERQTTLRSTGVTRREEAVCA